MIQLTNKNGGLEVMAYFMFKLVYDDDRRYAFERIERFDDFEEFIPISPI